MKKNGKNIEKSATAALESCLSNIPSLKLVDVQKEFKDKTHQFDIIKKISLPNKTIYLIAEVKNSGQPRYAREAVNQMLRYKKGPADTYFVFIAPYISDKAAEICKSEGVGYIDLSGNCLLSFNNIFIHKQNYPNLFKEKRELKSLFTPKAERVLRVLLCNPGKKWKTMELAQESGVSLGQISNVKKLLSDRELIGGKHGGFRLTDPGAVLSEWVEYYDYRKSRIQEFYSLKSVTDIEKSLSEYCNAKNILYAFTGFSGAARIAPAVRYNKAMAYAADLEKDNLAELSIKPVNSGGNLLMLTPYDEGVFYGSSEVDGSQIVSETQLYLDLQGFRGRGEEAAEMLYERIIEKPW